MASLRDLGLSEYEARAYRALLGMGPTTAKELSRASDVPMGRIYDVLNDIESRGLARSQTAGRPKKYVAVEPETALDRLLEERTASLQEQIDQYEATVEQLAGELEATDPVDEQFWTAALGDEESVELLVERLSAAGDRIVTVAAEPPAGFDMDDAGVRVVDHLTAALDRGVEVWVLVAPGVAESLPPALARRYRQAMLHDPDCAVRTSGEVNGTFTLIDDVEVCVQVPNPLAPAETFAMIDLKDPEFAAELEAEFAPRWERADRLDLD